MADQEQPARERINLQDFADHGAFNPPPKFFGQQASLSIAKWILCIFAGVLVLDEAVLIVILCRHESPLFDKVAELLKFFVQSVIPLVTLAVGYYLGDRGRNGAES